jgi:hypothetical protein
MELEHFLRALASFYEAPGKLERKGLVEMILSDPGWCALYMDRTTGRRVLAEGPMLDHEHEKRTAISLCKWDFDVLFAPKGMFRRDWKRFDAFLIRDHIILEVDFKTINSKNPDKIGKRIKEGSEQAPRLVLDIQSDIDRTSLIDGLRKGTERNNLLLEIIMIYKRKCYILPRSLILSEKIFLFIKK